MIADIEELESLHAPEIHARRLNAKEVLTAKEGEIVKIPLAGGTGKLFAEVRESENPLQGGTNL